jgi:hypothetical protein
MTTDTNPRYLIEMDNPADFDEAVCGFDRILGIRMEVAMVDSERLDFAAWHVDRNGDRWCCPLQLQRAWDFWDRAHEGLVWLRNRTTDPVRRAQMTASIKDAEARMHAIIHGKAKRAKAKG